MMDARTLDRGLIALLGLVGLVTAALVLRPAGIVFHTPLTEDAFYALGVARNIAAGIGITIDGVTPTNGFQPLFTVLQAACYWLASGSEVRAARLVTALAWIVYAATAVLVGLIARDAGAGLEEERRRRGLIAALLYGGGHLSFMHHFNGLETGLVVLLYAAIWRLHQRRVDQRRGGVVILGLAFGALVLARIDAAVVLAVYCVALVWRDRRLGWRAVLRPVAIGLVAVALSSPWWLYNLLQFGSAMPTSGTAQQDWAVDERRVRWGIWALGTAAMPSLWLGRLDELFGDGIALSILRAVVASWLVVAIWQRWRADSAGLGQETLGFARVMALGFAALTLYYVASFIAFWFYYRYLFPVAILAAVAVAWALTPLAAGRPRTALALAALLTLPTLASALLAQQGRTLHVETVYWQQLALIDAHVPPDAKVAAGQAGTLGYFRRATVNVDGKVNAAAIAHQDAMWHWLAAEDIRWFCDWPFYVEKYLGPDPTVHGWQRVGTLGIWQLWHRPE